MSEGKRPGGLTALAVINFILGAFGVLGVIGMAVLLGASEAIMSQMDAEAKVAADQMRSWSLVWPWLALYGVVTILLFVSGVGYLKQKKGLGRNVGNTYGVLSLVMVGMGLSIQSFDIGTIIGLVYPVLTLVLINTTFRDDFVN